jgi:hypothetical protein
MELLAFPGESMSRTLVYNGAVYHEAVRARKTKTSLVDKVMALRDQLAQAAQKEYDDWHQDEEGVDELLGCGGACDLIADAMGLVLNANGVDVMSDQDEGGDHAWLTAYDETTKEVVTVDIPPDVYEEGGGYNWKKRPDVVITADDVAVAPLKMSPQDFDWMLNHADD